MALAAMRMMGMRHLVVRMDITNRCNLKCRMCYLQHEDCPREGQEMDAELFDKIASQVLPRAKFLYLGCAYEPLMNRRCAEFLDRIGRARVPFTSLCTNGVLLSDEMIDAVIRARISQVVISFNAARSVTYTYLRPGAKIETLLGRMDRLRQRKEELGSELPVVVTSFTCMRRNLCELPEFVDLSAEHGASEVYVRHLLDFGDDDPDMTYRVEAAYLGEFDAVAKEAEDRAAAPGCGCSCRPGQAQGRGRSVRRREQVAGQRVLPDALVRVDHQAKRRGASVLGRAAAGQPAKPDVQRNLAVGGDP